MNSVHTFESVFLIEDNPGDARLIEEMLRDSREDSPIELVHEPTLESGLDRLSTTDPDVLLLDLRLPDSTGLETLERVLDAVEVVPVIVLTGMPETKLGMTAVSHGAQDYLVKDDVTSEVLVRTIRYSIERKKTERELRMRTHELTILNQLTRHDIRNDISLVVGRAREVTEYVEPRGQDAIDEIIQSSNHILQMTRTVGDIVETVTDDEAVDLYPVALADVLASEIDKARGLYRDVELSADGDLPGIRVRANDLLSSVVGNLISNAIFYNDKEVPVVTISVDASTESVVLRVADNGPGIPDRRKERIFEAGEQGMASSGMGIGLSLVDRLVTRYDGDIWVEDNDPEGSAFCVELARIA
ncbi:hybrid sensor histidine kinase/response regulator [Halalkalicoccus subterraneus]|uniref:hybrid sensor histidine kinase/response regulator n=1 Tax=Halalkalicoccus subterraneus TaxID=2675002 RepID=UPI000EFC76A2|nr:hybrid sensor histidine kinase/response regulator [Halalkalicoccus subterraneus]